MRKIPLQVEESHCLRKASPSTIIKKKTEKRTRPCNKRVTISLYKIFPFHSWPITVTTDWRNLLHFEHLKRTFKSTILIARRNGRRALDMIFFFCLFFGNDHSSPYCPCYQQSFEENFLCPRVSQTGDKT